MHAELPGADPPGWALPLCGGVHRCHPGGGYAAPGAPAVPLGGHRPDAGSRLCVRDLALHALQPARGLRHGLHPPLRHAHFR